jgi:beta-glucosidase
MDEDHRPLFPFGYGLSYTRFEYSDLRLSASVVALGGDLQATVTIRNAGGRLGTELVQLYVRDLVGSVTRPVKELKQYRHVVLEAGESCDVVFRLQTDELAFYGADNHRTVECGEFRLWIAPSAMGGLEAAFEVVPEGGDADVAPERRGTGAVRDQ